jgi:hypothetical protein
VSDPPISNERSQKTVGVDKDLFQEVYDSPASLPGSERYITSEEDVRKIEEEH